MGVSLVDSQNQLHPQAPVGLIGNSQELQIENRGSSRATLRILGSNCRPDFSTLFAVANGGGEGAGEGFSRAIILSYASSDFTLHCGGVKPLLSKRISRYP